MQNQKHESALIPVMVKNDNLEAATKALKTQGKTTQTILVANECILKATAKPFVFEDPNLRPRVKLLRISYPYASTAFVKMAMLVKAHPGPNNATRWRVSFSGFDESDPNW